MMNEHPQDSIPAFVLGTLDVDEAALVGAHVSHCTSCRFEVETFQAVIGALPYTAGPWEVPARVKQQLFARIAERAPDTRPQPRWVQVATGGGMALALVFALMLYTMNSRISTMTAQLQGSQQSIASLTGQISQGQQALAQLSGRHQQDSTAIAQLNTQRQQDQIAIARLRDQLVQNKHAMTFIAAAQPIQLSSPERRASAILYLQPGSKRAVLVVAGMPRAQAGKAYQFWLARPGLQVPAAIFDVDQEGVALLMIDAPRPVNEYNQVMVTVEQSAGGQRPSDQVVLSATLAAVDQAPVKHGDSYGESSI